MALDDMATLVAPQRMVLCEGRPLGTKGSPSRQEYDARCLMRIFAAECPDTEFISGGSSDEVGRDSIRLVAALERVASGVKCIRVIDRDGRTQEEVDEIEKRGMRIFRRRHLECYLLDDEVLETLCSQQGNPEKVSEVKKARDDAVAQAQARGKPADGAKSAAGVFFNLAKALVEIPDPGSNWEAFCATHMSKACQKGLSVYEELKEDIFGATAP